MNDDERTIAALRVALDERAAEIEPGDRLDEILERARPHRAAGVNRSWMLLAAAAAVLAVVAGVWLGLPDGSEPVPGGIDRPLPSATPSVGSTATEPPAAPTTGRRHRPPTATTAGALAVLPVYYVAPIGDDARIVRLYREWLTSAGVTRGADDQARARAAVELAMTAVPPGTDGYLRTWDGVDLLDVSVTDARITITLSGPGTTAFPEDTERVTVQQLVWTAQAAVGKGTIPVRFELADGSERHVRHAAGRPHVQPAGVARPVPRGPRADLGDHPDARAGAARRPGGHRPGRGVRLRGDRVVGAAP